MTNNTWCMRSDERLMGGCFFFFLSDDALVDGADGAPPGDGDQGNVGGSLVHAGVQAVLVRRYVVSVFCAPMDDASVYSFTPSARILWRMEHVFFFRRGIDETNS